MFNRNTLFVVIVAVAAGLGLILAQRLFQPQGAPSWPDTQAVRLFEPPRELPAFNLRQSDGTPLVPGELKGHWTLVFLGFTHCPDICPTTLAQLSVAQKQWESLPESTRPRVLFVSVDPERDSPDRIGEYAHAFHRDTLAATADVPALEDFTRSLSLVFAKVPLVDTEDGGAVADSGTGTAYTIDHSATMAVLDPQGRMAGLVQQPLDAAAIGSDLLALSQASAGRGSAP